MSDATGRPLKGFSSRAIRAATRPPGVAQRPDSVPIYQAVTFSSADSDELADIVTDRRPGYAYARIDNPTDTALAEAIAELEGAESAYVFATGMAAIHAALLSLVAAGDRILCTRFVYGTTRSLVTAVFGKLGVRVDFVDPTDIDRVEAALAATPTRVLYLETISNPTISVVDVAVLASLGHRHGAAVVVDNTFASPYLCRPVELGADLVVESATKYMGGHSDVLAGIVAGSRARIAAVRRVQIDTGATLAPFSAFLVLRGLPTLAIRMERHSRTAAALAGWLEAEPGVRRVYYPGLDSHPQRPIAAAQFPMGGGMLAFELAGRPKADPGTGANTDAKTAATAFIDALRMPPLTASLGSIHTIVTHPPSTTHRQLDAAALAAAGIAPGLLRASIGLEDLEDLQADFAQALDAARAAAGSAGDDSPEPPVALALAVGAGAGIRSDATSQGA
ncbi:MAG TPA: PLP-dependent aspartate aminotransferase family protein [Candidatus Saccharimonadales bacterium]|nr:PLP-dependent aspartate aminotransferase family protein [Candidatus Saccharimonadales bacterium]